MRQLANWKYNPVDDAEVPVFALDGDVVIQKTVETILVGSGSEDCTQEVLPAVNDSRLSGEVMLVSR